MKKQTYYAIKTRDGYYARNGHTSWTQPIPEGRAAYATLEKARSMVGGMTTLGRSFRIVEVVDIEDDADNHVLIVKSVSDVYWLASLDNIANKQDAEAIRINCEYPDGSFFKLDDTIYCYDESQNIEESREYIGHDLFNDWTDFYSVDYSTGILIKRFEGDRIEVATYQYIYES